MNKRNKRVKKFISSKFHIFGFVFSLICGYAPLLFVIIYDDAWKQALETPLLFAIFCFMSAGLSTFVLVAITRRSFSIITIDEDGISSALFKVFFKRHISWEEVREMKLYAHGFPYLIVSKESSLGNIPLYYKALRLKDVIFIQLNKKIYFALREFTDQPITGLTDEILIRLGWVKNN